MSEDTSRQTFQHLRTKHPRFIYHEHETIISGEELCFIWKFEMEPGFIFTPSMTFIPPDNTFLDIPNRESLEHLAFQLGMIELISYWKAACPYEIIVKPYLIPKHAVLFWEKLYYLGLGEFRYLNGINIPPEELFSIKFEGPAIPDLQHKTHGDKILLPIGGGKDSAVSLWMIKKTHDDKALIPFMMNPDPASVRVLSASNISIGQSFKVKRQIDPMLLDLNSKGYLNGHTPFSALLAFASHTAAYLTGCQDIILSNEASANESTIPGTHINHQYSKSFEFEHAFRAYLDSVSQSSINYFSLLRPFHEIHIATIFSMLKIFHSEFRSCNVGSKEDQWCGQCAKCLFTAVILSPFLDDQEIHQIIGYNILDNSELKPLLEELAGWADHKPFDCVGTTTEVRKALVLALKRRKDKRLPALLQTIRVHLETDLDSLPKNLTTSLNQEHHVPESYLRSLQELLNVSILYHSSE